MAGARYWIHVGGEVELWDDRDGFEAALGITCSLVSLVEFDGHCRIEVV